MDGAGAWRDARTMNGRYPRESSLVGVWRLIDYRTQYEGEALERPLGESPVGFILYTADGHMSGTMQRRGATPFAVADRLRATAEEKARAFDDYVAYCGRWRRDGDRVVHVVEASLLPNWIGDEQVREVRWIDDDRVELVGRWDAGGRRREAVVAWQRA